MRDLSLKLFLGLIAFLLATLTFELIPFYKQASSWNRCIKKTSDTLEKLKSIQLMDAQDKEVLAVMICNGAVFEPKLQTNMR